MLVEIKNCAAGPLFVNPSQVIAIRATYDTPARAVVILVNCDSYLVNDTAENVKKVINGD